MEHFRPAVLNGASVRLPWRLAWWKTTASARVGGRPGAARADAAGIRAADAGSLKLGEDEVLLRMQDHVTLYDREAKSKSHVKGLAVLTTWRFAWIQDKSRACGGVREQRRS